MIRVFYAFSGIGAFRSAFDKVGGFEFVGWCEIDKYAQKAYELILGLAKNYVFTHTTNRIDVMLSFKLFKHLFALPLKYF